MQNMVTRSVRRSRQKEVIIIPSKKSKLSSQVPNDPDETLSLDPIRLSELEIAHRNQRKSEFVVTYPATAIGSAMSFRSLTRISMENGTGSNRPSKVLVALNKKRTHVYFLPVVASDSEDALEVNYTRSGFTVNLYKLFAILDRFVQKGYRDVYKCEPTRTPVQIGDVKGRALVMSLASSVREPVRELSDEQKAQRKQNAANRKATNSNQSTQTSPAEKPSAS